MKKIFTLLSSVVLVNIASAQFTFSDDFESYTAGSALGPQSSTWTTWSGTEGGTEDVLVSTADSHGGTKSVYYSSTIAAGGPTDCVLPFGAQFTTGTFVMDFWIKVNAGKIGYFNFQQNTTIGQVWNSDWTFNADGTLDVVNQAGLNWSTTYTNGTWNHIIITADLNNSEWNVNIGGSDMGTFHNTSLGVASIDIYPINGSQYYIDDISITHTPYALTSNNIALSYITVPGGLAGSSVNVKALLRNVGTGTIANPYVSLYHNGSLVASQTYTGMNLASMDTQIVTITTPVVFTSGGTISADAQFSAGLADDDDTADDTLSYTYSAITPAPGKLVVTEEGTGTWCGFCPRGAVYMELLSTTYPGFFQGIAVHNADPMVVPRYDAGIGALIGGYPSVLVDRLTETDPSTMEPDFITRIQVAPKAMIVNGAQWNVTNDTLYVSLTTTFAQAVSSGNYKVACVLIEDDVTGSGSGYNQNNYYWDGSYGPMAGWESLPASVPASQMVYDFVARDIIPNFNGLSSAYTIPAAIGYVKTHNFAFPVPAGWSRPDMKIVGLFIDNTGKIDNASSTTIDDAIINGFVQGTFVMDVESEQAAIDDAILFPNPTTGTTTVRFNLSKLTDVVINISTIEGQRISSNNHGALVGTQSIEINTTDWAKGIYLVEILSGSTSKVMKLMVQ